MRSLRQVAWLLRLAAVSSRTDLVRLGLTVIGAAVGAVFVFAGLIVLSIEGEQIKFSNNLLNESGLRPGVATACWVLLVPTFIFITQCTRLGAAHRERKYAAFRLAGATSRQTAQLAAVETGLATFLGTVIGLALMLIIRALLAIRIERSNLPSLGPDEQFFGYVPLNSRYESLPVHEPFPWLPALAVCLLLPVLAGAISGYAVNRSPIGPLGVSRQQRRPDPPAWPALLLLAAPLTIAVAFASRWFQIDLVGPGQVLLVIGVLLAAVGLISVSAWLAAATGRLVSRRCWSAAWLIAGRRLETHPYSQSWSMSAVVICAFFASAAAILKSEILSYTDDAPQGWETGGGEILTNSGDDFYARAFELVNYGFLIALAIASAGLIVALAESLLERRRSLMALSAMGTPIATLRRAVIIQGLLPLVPALLIAIILGTALPIILISYFDSDAIPIQYWELALIFAIGMTATALATILTLPFLDRTVQPSELRYE
jgi:hypothetical protein